ncbi:MAG: hypothetical protein M1833_005902 [Piccolia ochrophora]|nr:MAG: hypothetical protein M1833_005902 [Piccolia ochrophora]
MAGQEHSDEGASPRELLLEACRRNNLELLQEVIQTVTKANPNTDDHISTLLNDAVDAIGNHCLHLAATHGSFEVLDMLLDQEGLEVDPLDRMEGDTPLHKAVRFVNTLSKAEWKAGQAGIELLIDAGADPRVRNKARLKPFDLVDPANTHLRTELQKAEFTITAGDDVIDEDADEGPTGSASDSD